ncbi:acyl carrier protein [Streptomyces sp. NPDC127068]|uniref:acyl carrier protein n=1 Tax=Streptomyces sp. NPDC127068 TaxID=3347127 RepID=UPI003656A3D7
MSDAQDRVRDFIATSIVRGESTDAPPDDVDLVDAGYLDSIRIMKLVAFVEETFGIEVGVSDPREHFQSVASIIRYIDMRTGDGRDDD